MGFTIADNTISGVGDCTVSIMLVEVGTFIRNKHQTRLGWTKWGWFDDIPETHLTKPLDCPIISRN